MTLKTSRTPAIRAVLGTTATSLAVLVLATSGALAQEGTETVTVTGFRASLENTIALKKESTQIVEAVSAEDIGKLPDQSIGEAISRLPGIATQRLNGRAQDIAIRGLSADFATTLLNGREQVSTNDNRSVQFDQYPAELMSGVVIYKTPSADLVGAGLSGTVDMRTTRPLDHDGMVLSLNVRGETNSLGELNPGEGQYGWRLGGTYIDQFAGGKIGLMVGIALMDSLNPYNEYGPWGWPSGTYNGSTIYGPGGVKFSSVVDDLKRSAAISTLQYRPNENFESTLDLFFTRYKDKWQLARIEGPMAWGGQNLAPGFTVTDGYVTAGSWAPGVKQVGRQEADRHNNDLFAIGWKNTYNAGPWTAMLDAGFSSVQRYERLLEEYAGTGAAGYGDVLHPTDPPYGYFPGSGALDPMPFTLDRDNIMHVTPAVDYGDYGNMLLASPQSWSGPVRNVPIGQEGYLKYDWVHDHMVTLKAEMQREMGDGFLKSITAGLYYTNRSKSKWANENFLTSKTNADAVAAYATAHGGSMVGFVQTGTPIPTAYRTGVSEGLNYFGFPRFAAWDPEGLFDSGFYIQTPNTGPWVYTKGFQVNEIVYTGYAKADIDTLLGDHALTGNVGLQFVMTHQTSNGYRVNGTESVPQSGGTEYGQLLPSMNLAFEIDDQSKIRLGAARELVRARMDQMVYVNSYTYTAANRYSTDLNLSPWSGTTGNAKLKPWIADAVDVSYEYYFSRDTYMAVAGFYKNLESYIYQQRTLYDFTGYAYDTTVVDPTPHLWQGYVTQDVNGSGGMITGLEVSGAVAGGMISDWLEGFGATANMSYTDSSIKGVTNSGANTPLPGLSKLVYNATVFFEKWGFSARLNYNYRSKFFSEIKGFDNSYTRNEFKEQGWLGAQIGYTFDEGPMNGLSVNFQADNLMNERQTQYQYASDPNDARQVLDWWRFGTTYQLSLTYKLN
jgi:iron complex outermembrane recepter protein